MERVKNILQKLQELYYAKHQKSAIDIDLMLDYTRVMYADLLEWRGTFKEEPPTTESAEPNAPMVAMAERETAEEEEKPAEEKEAATEKKEPAAEEKEAATEEKEVAEETAQPEEEPEPDSNAQAQPVSEEAAPATKESAATSNDKAYQPMEHDEPAPKEPVAETQEVVVITPEKEYIDVLQKDASGISFEPPSAPEPRTEIREELLIEEPAVQQEVLEKPAPPPVAIPLPDMAPEPERQKQPVQPSVNLFSAVKSPKDIRSVIGINDKYLFLNELFNNHKSNYEETLDKLNHFSTADQAEDWIRTKVAPVHKWDQEDATVTSFYSLVKRHFSER